MLAAVRQDHAQFQKRQPAKEMITAGINFAIVTGRLEDRRRSVEGWDETSDREAEED